MRAGMGGLRLTPDQFWALTPAELRLMLGEGAVTRPLLRDGLDALLAAYPDRPKGQGDDG
jgi:uncharacterized phage protein (TIGR02216 family)